MICSSRFCKDKKQKNKTRIKNFYRHKYNQDDTNEKKGDPWRMFFKTSLEVLVILQAHLEPLVLKDLFNGHHLLAVDKASLVHHTERPITNHLQGKSKDL